MENDGRTKFLSLLSHEINRGSNKFSFNSLSDYLIDAIKALPDGSLKDSLLKREKENSEYLWSLLKVSKKSTEISFNILNKDGLEETLKNIATLNSSKEKLFYLSQVALCHPSEDVFGLLLKAQIEGKSNQSKLQALINVTELCGRLTVGCNNSRVLNERLHFFLSEVVNIYEDFKVSDPPDESWVKLKDAISGLLIHAHLKSQRQKEKHKNDSVLITDLTEYKDLLAALLSLYIDVLMISKSDESTSDHVSNMVYILLGDSPSHILDTVNQISPLDKTSRQIMLPFLRKTLHSTRSCSTGFIGYIKYVSAARRILKWVYNLKNDAADIGKVVNTVSPPGGLVTWISDKDDSLVKDLNLSGLNKKKITNHLVQFDCDDIMEKLLDLVAEVSEERTSSENILENDGVEKKSEEESDLNPVFFVDSQGNSDLVVQCQEDEFTNTDSDKSLQRQIDVMLEQLEAASENEEDDLDISFDDDEEGNFLFMDSDPKQSGQEQGISLETNKEFQGIEDVENQTDIQIPEIINNRAKSSEKKGKRTRKSGTPVVKKKSSDSVEEKAKEVKKKRKKTPLTSD